MENWEWTNEYVISTPIGDDFTFDVANYDSFFLIDGYNLNRTNENGIVGYKSTIFMYTVYEEFVGIEISFKGSITEDKEVEIVNAIISNLQVITTKAISYTKSKI